MKITMILFSGLFLAGCAGVPVASKRARNGQCLDSSKLQVTTILKEGILAQLCPSEFPSYYDDAFDACLLKGTAVFLPVKAEENNYVDDQKVTLAEDKCFAEDGVYIHSDDDKQFQKIVEKTIKEMTGEDIDLGDSKRRIRKLKIINTND